ncbi:MAG: hypothetical protein R3D02_09865 [Hyphomicrobiales bacterium]
MNAAAPEKQGKQPAADALQWETDVGLLDNRMIWKALVTLIVTTFVVIAILMSFILALNGEAESIPPLLGMFALVCAGLFVLMLVIMLVVFGNRIGMRFVLDAGKVRTEIVDRRARTGNRIAVIVGALAGKPGLAGAGLIASADEVREFEWRQIVAAKIDERRRVIELSNDWRVVACLFCTPEVFEAAKARVAASIARKGKRTPGRGWRYPLVQPLLLTLGVFLALAPVMAMPYPFEIDLFPVIFTLCFALATVWLIPILAWAVLAGVTWLILAIGAAGIEPHKSYLDGETWTGFGSLYGDEWLAMGVAAAGLAFLVWMSWAMLRGRLTALLTRDMTE